MILRLGTICDVVYAYGADPHDESHYAPIFETGMYLNRLPDGRAEVMIAPDKIVRCSENRLKIRCLPDNPAYERVRADLFP